MKGKLIILSLMTMLFIFLDFKKRKNYKKTALSIVIFASIIGLGWSGFVLIRGIPPLFLAHIILLAAAYIALMWYLFKGKLYYYIIASPILTEVIYIILNFIDGSRYES